MNSLSTVIPAKVEIRGPHTQRLAAESGRPILSSVRPARILRQYSKRELAIDPIVHLR
jgi:hypothetical protein